jgi:hypothetical protein
MSTTLADELQHFRLKTLPTTEDALEWRERPHDDLVFAVAVAAWQGERGRIFRRRVRARPIGSGTAADLVVGVVGRSGRSGRTTT